MSFKVLPQKGIDLVNYSPRIIAEHFVAYHFVVPFAAGKRVLEIGCGDGYGAFFLSGVAEEMTAVDLFSDTVEEARKKYPSDRLKFLQMNGVDLKFPDDHFDLVVSFQVIEHIVEEELQKYVGEVKRVLKAGGVACISTLNLTRNQKPGQPYDKSPFHDKEFTLAEFRAFLEPFFSRLEIYGLYTALGFRVMERLKKWGLFNFLPDSLNPVKRFYRRISVSHYVWRKRQNLDGSIDLMALCTK